MVSLESIDLLLGEAIERILEASDGIKESKELNSRDDLKKIGRIIAEIWTVREEIYGIQPELKRDFNVEYEKDPKRFDELNDIFKKAIKLEKNGDADSSIQLFNELHQISHFGYFRLLAEAGLYRNSVRKEKTE